MEIRIKAKVNNTAELKILVQAINTIEKEHGCNCTLLDVEVG